MVLGVPLEHEWLVPKLFAWEPLWLRSSASLNSRQSIGDIPVAKQELGVQVRSQAGAWERDGKASAP
jgi:hypothetical protein